MNKILNLFFIFAIFISTNTEIAMADKSGIIKIPKHHWSSQKVGAEIIGKLLNIVGENVEFVEIDSKSVYQAMANGKIDLVNEINEIHFGSLYEDAKSSGNIEEVTIYEAVAREDWWYPDYVEDICPGMPNWKALAECSDKFERPDSGGKGVFIAGPVENLKHDLERTQALGMNFDVRNAGSPGSIWAELDAATSQKMPIVIFNKTPSFIGDKYPGKFVEFPKYNERCTTDPSWGINPMSIYDCGNFIGSIKIAVNKNFKNNHPEGYKLIKKINFSNADLDKMDNYIETKEMSESEAAKKWLDEHKSKWSIWVK